MFSRPYVVDINCDVTSDSSCLTARKYTSLELCLKTNLKIFCTIKSDYKYFSSTIVDSIGGQSTPVGKATEERRLRTPRPYAFVCAIASCTSKRPRRKRFLLPRQLSTRRPVATIWD